MYSHFLVKWAYYIYLYIYKHGDVKVFVLIGVNDETLANDVKVIFQQTDKKSLYILIHLDF